MTTREKAIVKGAMAVLEEATCGDVGGDGPSLVQMDEKYWANGKLVNDNAYYDTTQHVWRILEKLLK